MDALGPITETLDTEIKNWLRLDDPADTAVLAKACIALRNNDGGRLILGIEDKTFRSLDMGRPSDVVAAYHPDKITKIVGEYSAPKFEVRVYLKEYQGHAHPEIVVPGGIEFPVITRRSFESLVRQNAVYVRTISNGRPGTCEPVRPEDWQALIDRCFDNREADIGRFFRRHLAEMISELQRLQPGAATSTGLASVTESERLLAFGRDEFKEAWSSRSEALVGESEVEFYGFSEVAACIVDGQAKTIGIPEILDTVFVRQPRLTGWPPWVDSRGMREQKSRPYVRKGGWEALIPRLREHWTVGAVDFWRIDPGAKFYLLRTYENDTARSLLERGVEPGELFDFYLLISRTAEAIATVKAFTDGLAEGTLGTSIHFSFRWSGLKGRKLCCWVDPRRDCGVMGQQPEEDEVVVSRVIPLEKANATLWEDVRDVTQAVFDLFGVRLDEGAIRDIVDKTLQRRQ